MHWHNETASEAASSGVEMIGIGVQPALTDVNASAAVVLGEFVGNAANSTDLIGFEFLSVYRTAIVKDWIRDLVLSVRPDELDHAVLVLAHPDRSILDKVKRG
mmetsp:Transcript_37730/g.99760  ORF Transcript_37730/g.99760 Transcript_37730/m.99760 type:complete len:103 (+) Transcript_37730:153-461(+)|eukprot:CAMPEP_0115848040 /NCGR_PEP_ID=MMETSP0287-20121206/10705_1 /TAXON_ID=412157 /ORGANISM="Chrysochromulina rotalis, Strain UIO044" /LENGTH=102 /DNA_ID=CAMNT_0003301917 /DNA_START=140 /DNA_END=448 /DNA_ORIENTATION=-